MTPQEFKATLAKAGIAPDKPLFAVLFATFEAAETARDTVTDGARGLTSDGEQALIERVSREAAEAAESTVRGMVRGFNLRTAGLLACTGLLLAGGGYWMGQQQGAQALESAAFLAHLVEMNDLRTMRQHCERTQRQQAGGTACDLPPVWIRLPSQAPRQ